MALERITKGEWSEKVGNKENPVLVEFMLPTCPSCQKMEPFVKKVAEKYTDKADVYQVHAKEQIDLSREYGVRSTPTFILFCKGEPVTYQVGETYPKKLEDMIEDGMKDGKKCVENRTKIGSGLTGYQ